MRSANYIDQLEHKARTREAHDIEPLPDGPDLEGKICDIEDKLDAVARAFGVKAVKDYRGRWRVVPLRRGGE